jgi:4-hydroxy-4-methyl-2-oxoglutarate aldolase
MTATDDRLEELGAAYTAVVADALDALGLRNQSLDPAIRPLRPGMKLAAQALPVVIEPSDVIPERPYEGEMDAIDALQPGYASFIVVEGDSRAAAWGELFSCAAMGRGARGAIVDGSIRDARQIVELGFPVFCRSFSPLDTLGRAVVRELGTEARCGDVVVRRGDYLLADEDGIVVVPKDALDDVLERVRAKARTETSAKDDLLAGARVREVWERYGVF